MTSSTADKKVVPLPRSKPPPPIEEIMAKELVTYFVGIGRHLSWDNLEPGEQSTWIAAVRFMRNEIERLPDDQKRFFHSVEDRGFVKGVGKVIAELVRRHNYIELAAQLMKEHGVTSENCNIAGFGPDLIDALRCAESSPNSERETAG